MNTSWHRVEIIGAVAGIISLLVTVTPILRGYFRGILNWWSLRSRRTAVKRPAKLQEDLQKLNEPPTLDEPRAIFYTFLFLTMGAMSGGLMAAAWFAYGYLYQINPQQPPNVFLAFAWYFS